MTMDYQHPYSFYPEYYNPSYHGTGYQYSQQQRQPVLQQQHYLDQHNSAGAARNFNTGSPADNHHLSHQNQQKVQPYLPTFQQHQQQQLSQHQQQLSQHQQQHTQHQQLSQHQHSNYSSPYLPNFLVSSGTGLTPTLTPTSLATIEQSFLELQSAQQPRGWDSVTQSGFVPPVIDAGHSTEVSQDSQEFSSEYSDSEWEPQAKRGRGMKDLRNGDLIATSNGIINAAPQRKYTRRNKDEKLPPEEEERRQVRRERNKLAAAKCRQRRVDHTNILLVETEKLETEQSQLESEIQSLQQEKDQLEFILQAHQPLCQFGQSRPLSGKVKKEPGSHPASCGSSARRSHDISTPLPENLSISASSVPSNTAASSTFSSTTSSLSQGTSETSVFNSRPNSLPLIKRDRAHMLLSTTGITINTPTSGLTITPSSLYCPDLGSMIDGSTGLTPLTGMSCSSQVQRNAGEGGSETESTLISL